MDLYTLPEMQRVKNFETLCLGSFLANHLKAAGQTEESSTFYKYFCEYANIPPREYLSGYSRGCLYPLSLDQLDKLDEQHPANWKNECQFWIDNFYEKLAENWNPD